MYMYPCLLCYNVDLHTCDLIRACCNNHEPKVFGYYQVLFVMDSKGVLLLPVKLIQFFVSEANSYKLT